MRTILDLERYPLHEPDSAAYRELVASCRNDLAVGGMVNLQGFVKRSALSRVVNDVNPVMDAQSFKHSRFHNVYFQQTIQGLAPDHPALRQFKTANRTICADQIPDNDLVKLYEWPPLCEFLAAALEKNVLFTMPDQLARLNVMSYHDGEALNWHFDRSEFTVTLLLQSARRGGHFEYRNDLRSDDDPNYQGVSRLIDGLDDHVQQLRLSPGTLNVFRGKNTLHRITPVEGDRSRMVAVFSYYECRDVYFSDEERMGFYGRIQ